MAVVGESCVTHAKRVEVAQVGDGVADLVEAFNGDRGDELACAEVGEGGSAVGWMGEVGGVQGLEAM